MDPLPERHLECSECKKPIAVVYTEIVGKMIYRQSMCADCPFLQQKLHGQGTAKLSTEEATAAGLACGGCGTTIDEVKRGGLLGCSLCYDVFNEVLVQELSTAGKISPTMTATAKKAVPIYLGRLPGQSSEINPAMKLLALHQALNETVGREDYEQAAWLRDQIKALTEENAKGKDNESPKP